MAEAIHTENQTDLAAESASAQQMVELQRPLLSSQPTNLSSSYLQQQHVDGDVTINIHKMINDCGDGRLLPNCCIYRVPIRIRGLKEEAYTPTVVSVGPLHYDDKRLQDMERHKEIMLKRFTQRAKLSLDDLVGRVRKLEPEVRTSYSETIKLSKEDLVKLTLIDAGFIIELLVMGYDEMDEGGMDTDAKLSQPWLDDSIRKDLMLIENQLPFFAIEELFNALPHDYRGSLPPFLELVYKYFGHYNRQNIKPNPKDDKIKHFTDLLRLFYLQGKKCPRNPFSGDGSHLLYNASALQEAGIKLKPSKSRCFLDLKFSGSILEIPQIVVDDDTELLFRNMIALEQCHYPSASYITDYALVLDYLIDTHQDVDLLIHKKIIRQGLGDSKKVAKLFNGLWKNVVQLNFNSQYFNICQRLNDYCQDPCHEKMATLRRDYCNTPWHTMATFAGIVLLILTIVQTVFSVLQVALK